MLNAERAYIFIYIYLGLAWCINEVNNDVCALNYASESINGEQELCIRLKKCIVYPKHGTEQRNNVGDRLKPFRRFLFVHSPKCWPTKSNLSKKKWPINSFSPWEKKDR